MPNREEDERLYRERCKADARFINTVVIMGFIIIVLLGMVMGDY